MTLGKSKIGKIYQQEVEKKRNKKRASYSHRTATTVYPCCVPTLGEFNRSWSYETCPMQK